MLQSALAETTALLVNDRSRRRAPLIRRQHELRRMLDPGYAYTSQAGQDAVVDRLFGGKHGGTYADIGGYDGVTGSNTLFLEQWRGWTGVLVEPVPSQLAKARAQRRCDCIGLAVAATEGTAEFVEVTDGFTQMSGLASSYDPVMLTRLRADLRHAERNIAVQTRTLSRILTDAGIPHPDFVSLDIEGGEVTVLAAFPFHAHRVGIWAIENNTASGDIGMIMRAAGYDLIEFAGPDEIWRIGGL